MPSVPEILKWIVMAVAVLMWIEALRQRQELKKQPDNGVVRAVVVTLAWIGGLLSVFGFVFWSNDQKPPILTLEQAQIATRGYMATALFLALYFRSLYRRRSN